LSNYDSLDLSILKTLITNKKHAVNFVDEFDVTKQKFFSPDVWNFANIVTNYTKAYQEVPTLRVLSERISKTNPQLVENIKTIWSALDKFEYNEKEYKHDLEKFKTRFAEKQISDAHDSLAKLLSGKMDISKGLGEMQRACQNIRVLEQKKTYDAKNIKDYLTTFVDKFNVKKNNPDADLGLMTNYSFLDYATNGLKPADFVLIAGESGFGKSLFLNNIAIQVWLQDNSIFKTNSITGIEEVDTSVDISKLTGGKDIIYFSLEMPYEDCFNRLLSRLSGVPSRKIENAELNKEEFAKIKACLDFIKEYPFNFKIVDIADASANDIELILSDSEENFDAIFVDYLGIMKTNEKNEDQDWLKQGIIAYELRGIGRRHKKPVFSAVQLNRKAPGKDPSENIGLSRLARSGTIATHATHVIQIENRPNEEKFPDFIYHIIKNRKGPKGKGVLVKNLSSATLLDKDERLSPTEETLDSEKSSYDDYFKDQNDISDEMEDLEL
jgi:replicative DNA helicase